ncbi:hypothetical protein P152DRAFT_417484 [Eremomyces bilateralis CBS 781.70]|uniref:PQ loop repeat protein n=1 Tax=Eremomyces bilateralis CBS 781.70 TaxID=1392243 RepID=A0A6G1G2Y7_9PEZI|nr:uncharacterized protein P152DRAFT_417484 [Eremomyces bilateralis CBS 781.70]KAF1812352.1 hypothetical protein P152DRAFT_417484 [Eremomyces bilateralis CBS 781.70]
MGFVNTAVGYLAPLFLITSPITSYADQIHSIHRTRTSAGFSLDIPLIMLVSSILKIFFWITDHYSLTLLTQAILMIFVQSLLLHVSLTHRPATPPSVYQPFSDPHHHHHHHHHTDHTTASDTSLSAMFTTLFTSLTSPTTSRPYNFWRWRSARPYWNFLMYFTGAVVAIQLFLGPTAPGPLSFVQSTLALTTEAMLPVPQLFANYQRKGCKGFRLSVIVNWVIGDAFKMWWFFMQGTEKVPVAFRVCGIFQACCDIGLGVQYWVWGEGKEYEWERERAEEKEGLGDVEMEEKISRIRSRSST